MKEYEWNKKMLMDLFDPTDRVRGIGRSTMLAEVFCDLALKYIGTKIQIIDHSSHPEALRYMVNFHLQDEAKKRNKALVESGERLMYKIIRSANDGRSYRNPVFIVCDFDRRIEFKD